MSAAVPCESNDNGAPLRAKRTLPLLTNSELKTFRRCVLEHHLSYELGYRGLGEAEALRFGSLFHLGLEAWWRALWAQQLGTADNAPLSAAIEAMREHAEDEFDMVRAGVLLQGYDARWGNDDLEVLGVELEFRAPLINPESGAASRTFELAGKLDALVRNRADGLVYIVEHKTSSEDIGVGSQYWQRLTLDSQISMYFAGGRSLGYDIAGCIYDVIGKPRHAPLRATAEESRKYTKRGELYANQRAIDETPEEYRQRLVAIIAEAPDRFYQRGTVIRLEADERDAMFDNWQTARALRDAQVASRWPRNPDNCMRYGRLCSYFPVCTRTASLEDPTLFRRVDNVHQELSIDAA
jgi:PD-(D/E)XK nuclease superfamily